MRGMLMAGAVVVLVAACSSPDEGEVVQVDQAQEEPEQGPVVADPVEWQTPLVVEGIGGDVEVTPLGVQYVTSEEISSPTEHDHPARDVFAVVRFTVSAEAESVTVPHGWGWRQDGQEYGPGDGGNASTAPWMGAVPEVHAQTTLMEGEEPTVGYATFDLPGPGGELIFTDAVQEMVRWQVPEQGQGEMVEWQEWMSDH